MAKENKIQMPGFFGGLVRYDEEYGSKFMIGPGAVIGFIVFIILMVVALKIFFPASTSGLVGGIFFLGMGGFPFLR